MGFAVPAFLIGLALAGIPFLVHLIFRRRAPQVLFAATRFVKAASRRTARRRRIDNLLLLALRMLLLGLLAVGLAGPFIRRVTGTGRGGKDVVVILDNSLSMSAASRGGVVFSRAKEAVDAILAGLTSGDFVAVIPTVRAGEGSIDETDFAPDLTRARERIAKAVVGNGRGSLGAALVRAAELFGKSAASEKLLYVVTDLQANSVPERDSLADSTRSTLVTVPVIAYDCGLDAARNLYVSDMSVLTQGAVVGTALEVRAKISSTSPVEETVPVYLSLSGSRVASRAVTLTPSGSGEVSLPGIVPSAGILDAVIEIETADAIPADDRRFVSLAARERVKALVLRSEAASPEFDDDAFFLRRALDPFSAEGGARSPFEVTVGTYAEVRTLAPYDIVYVLMRPVIGEGLSDALSAYLDRGGSVVAFACEDASIAGAAPWLPARLVSIKSGRRSAGESFALASINTDSHAFSVFRDEPPSLYNTVRAYDYWLVDTSEGASEALARFDTGDPCVVMSARSSGRTVLFTVAPTRSMSNLPASGFFLPMLHEISYYMASSSGRLGGTSAGEAVVLAAAGTYPDGLVVTSPDGQQRLVEAEAGRPLVYHGTGLPGPYRVREREGAADLFWFSVNTDPSESDLRRLDKDALADRLPGRKVFVVSSPESLEQTLASLQPVLALGDVILYAVLAVALFECLAASQVSIRSAKVK